jgi:hypothetical protein
MIRYKHKRFLTNDDSIAVTWMNHNCHRDNTVIISYRHTRSKIEIVYSEPVDKNEIERLEREALGVDNG